MIEYPHQPTIILAVRRCYECGRFWALEKAVEGSCPSCEARRRHMRMEEEDAKDRTIRSLRGAITKMKKAYREGSVT